jgi:virginiamycin B lyase
MMKVPDFPTRIVKSAVEYPLPASPQTHEIVEPVEGLLLVSQQPSGALVKIRVDPASGRPLAAARHVLNDPFDGLHGLFVSRRHPGHVWVTLQFTSELLLVDPVAGDLGAPPRILQRIALPPPARGPHVVIEADEQLWTSCKDSHHVVRVSSVDPSDCAIHACLPRPIFVAVHPTSGDVYASLDQASAIFCVAQSGAASTLALPDGLGATPVGLVPGPDGNVWFTLLGNASGGTGGFGRIDAERRIQGFRLSRGPAMGAALIHLAFAPDAGEPGAEERVYLLGSSMAATMALNAVFEVGFNGGYAQIARQQTIALPSQSSMTHRVLPTRRGLYVTALGACAVAHLSPARSTANEGINELSDPYSLWGTGVPAERLEYGQ